MPNAPKRPCRHRGCPHLVEQGYCPTHTKETRREPDLRPSATARGYDHRWRKASHSYLDLHPLCVLCPAHEVRPAALVDHITPITGKTDPMFWDHSNWQPLCRRCHTIKTGEDRRKGLTR